MKAEMATGSLLTSMRQNVPENETSFARDQQIPPSNELNDPWTCALERCKSLNCSIRCRFVDNDTRLIADSEQ